MVPQSSCFHSRIRDSRPSGFRASETDRVYCRVMQEPATPAARSRVSGQSLGFQGGEFNALQHGEEHTLLVCGGLWVPTRDQASREGREPGSAQEKPQKPQRKKTRLEFSTECISAEAQTGQFIRFIVVFFHYSVYVIPGFWGKTHRPDHDQCGIDDRAAACNF